MFRVFRRLLHISRQCHYFKPAHYNVGKRFYSLFGLVTVSYCEGSSKLQSPDPSKLTHTYLIKNASLATIDAATSLLTQSLSALLDVHQKYIEALDELVELLELNIKVLGEEEKEDLVWDAMLTIRSQVNECRSQKQDLEITFSCAMKALEAAAEAAHLAGAEYAGIAASERLHSARSRLQSDEERVQEAEMRLKKIELENIKKTSEHGENQNKKSLNSESEKATDSQAEHIGVEKIDLDDLDSINLENLDDNE